MKIFYHIGRYFLLLSKVFAKPEKGKIYYRLTTTEIINLGINSIAIVAIISTFMGAVTTIQTTYNIENPLLPVYLVGVAVRDSILLEFASTIVALILAGKVGSSISSEIGTMRVTEQIDALEMMGVNSASYLILPKIIALVLFSPILCLFSMLTGMVGGYLVCVLTHVTAPSDFILGLHYGFVPYYVFYALIKSVVFGFIITSVSSYFGYYTDGGALEVGKSSTKAVVYSTVMILVFNLILTQLLLS